MGNLKKSRPMALASILLVLLLVLVPSAVSAAHEQSSLAKVSHAYISNTNSKGISVITEVPDTTTAPINNIEIRSQAYNGNNIDDIIDKYGDGITLATDATQFTAFYYDIDNNVFTESIIIKDVVGTEENIIGKGGLAYQTTIQPINYQFGAWGMYPVIGLFGEKYIPLNPSRADKLAKLVLDSNDKYTIRIGEILDLGGGYALDAKQIDVNGSKVWFEFTKDGKYVDDEIISVINGSVNTWEVELDGIQGENDVVVLRVNVNQVSQGAVDDIVQIEGLWLIDCANAMTIGTGDEFGALNDVSINGNTLIISNKDIFTLTRNSDLEIGQGLYFKVADTLSSELRFYIYKQITDPGTCEVRGQTASGESGFVWNATNFAGFYYDLDNNVGPESLNVSNILGNMIPAGNLVYSTTIQNIAYEYSNPSIGWDHYSIIGLFGDMYIPINPSKAEKLAKLVLDSDDKYTVRTGEILDLGEGYAVEVKQIDVDSEKIWLEFTKDGKFVGDQVILLTGGLANTWEVELDGIQGENNVTVLRIHVNQVIRGSSENITQIEGVWLIDYANAATIGTDDKFGALNDVFIAGDMLTISNREAFILTRDNDIEIGQGMYFKVADTPVTELRYYPFVVIKSAQPANGQLILEETQITINGSEQYYPFIYGDRIVWEDYRNGNSDIYMYDLSTHQETRITTNEFEQYCPSIYGNRIVWEDYRNGNSDIYMYDLSTSTETRITSDGSDQILPSIYGNRIVWEDYRNGNSDIYMYDLSIRQETRITTNEFEQYNPVTYGDRIVWEDHRNGNWDIYIYDLSTSKETRITTNELNQELPVIYGDRIIYSDDRNGGSLDSDNLPVGNWDIYMYDLSTLRETQITTNESIQCWNAIYGDRIVWEDYRNGNSDIYMYNLYTSVETQITTNEFNQYNPVTYGDRIIWWDSRNGNWDIYMCTVSGEEKRPAPVANFTSNVISGYAPLTVQFRDLSQNVVSRIWDFDNNGQPDSSNVAPVYVYAVPGAYTVNLTVSNENGVSSKTASINVLESSSSHGSNDGDSDRSGGSSHSSGGSGGGGGSPEPARNVEVKELSQTFVTNGKTVQFDFTKNATCVVYVGFDARKTVGKTTTIVEQLKNKSTLVSNLSEGEVYKYFNVWVGNSGFATSSNIENPVICFKVTKSWIKDKQINQDSIVLNRYSEKKWEQLPVSLLKEDSKYLYFTASVPGYSFFAITGKSMAGGEINEIQPENQTQDSEEKTGNTSADVQKDAEQGKNNSLPGFTMIYGVASLFTLYLHKRK